MKNIFNYFSYIFVIVSLYFVIRHLNNQNLLVIPNSINTANLLLSVLFLLIGFMFNCLSWKSILRSNGINATMVDSVRSIGISIMGKYIPGKVWLITGMSGTISQATGSSFIEVTYVATLLQLIIISIGACVGVSALFPIIGIWYISFIYSIIVLTVVVLLVQKKRLILFLEKLKNTLTEKWLLPIIRCMDLRLFLYILGIWLSWSLGFYFLCASVGLEYHNLWMGFSFALASSVGILVVFAPGGLGVREGLLGLLLSRFGLKASSVASIATFSRLWFFAGELMIFIVALLIALTLWLKHKRRMHNTIV